MSLSIKLGALIHAQPLSVEIVPSELASIRDQSNIHHPFLFADNHLGIPKSVLYKAYLEALSTFGQTKPGGDPATIIRATSVILLANPAHNTALNRRKELVRATILQPAVELAHTSLLQCLPDGAKSSILWHHRRWLLCQRHDYEGSNSDAWIHSTLHLSDIQPEIALVERTAELYPRNYHAWAHRFHCLQYITSKIRSHKSTTVSDNEDQDEWTTLLLTDRARTRSWLERHVADHSAAHYLTLLERALIDLGLYPSPRRGAAEPTSSNHTALNVVDDDSILAHACSLVRTYSSHESLWLYLRGAIQLQLRQPAAVPGVDLVTSDATTKVVQLVTHDLSLVDDGNEYKKQFLGWTERHLSPSR